MSSLWTPEGEHQVTRGAEGSSGPSPAAPAGGARPEPGTGAGGPPGADGDEELVERLEELRRQLVATPAEVVVANHAYGLFELAAIHLSQQPAGLAQARLAVDALGALVGGLAGRLGEAEASLVEALDQIRLAYVRIEEAQRAQAPDPGSAGTGAGEPVSGPG